MKIATSSLLLALLCTITIPVQAQDLRDPLDGIDDLVPVPHFTSVILPIGALAAVLLLTESNPPLDNTRGIIREGSWFIHSDAGYYRSYHDSETDVFEGSVGFGTYVRKWLAIGVDFHVTGFRDERIGAGGIGSRPFLRWHFLNKSRLSAYFEQGLGIIFTSKNFPPGGTKINFTPTYSLGLSYRLTETVHLLVSLRHYHISNGNLVKGADRNPGFDSNGVTVGYQFQF